MNSRREWFPVALSTWRSYQNLPSRLAPISFTLNEVSNFIPPSRAILFTGLSCPSVVSYVNPLHLVVVHFLEQSTLFYGFTLNNSFVWVTRA